MIIARYTKSILAETVSRKASGKSGKAAGLCGGQGIGTFRIKGRKADRVVRRKDSSPQLLELCA
jgi:hypothetical protein